MPKYYCHKCGVEIGILNGNINDFNPTGNDYQMDKFFKHTIPPTINPRLITVFDLSQNKSYKSYIVNTLASGCIEIEDEGEINIVWLAGKTTGWKYIDCVFQCDVDAVKVVLHNNNVNIHAYPTGSVSLSSQTCVCCGANIARPDSWDD